VMSAVFIARPRLAAVISIVITLTGALAMLAIPVAQYPNLTPPTVNLAASYPGASAEEVAGASARRSRPRSTASRA
jgi:multidrug efflux pump subunit AcrB